MMDSFGRVETWDEQALGPLDLTSVKARYQPAYHYRIQQHHYEPHSRFSELGATRTYYVVSGKLMVTVEGGVHPFVIGPKQFLRVPSGRYIVSISEPVVIIKVLEVP